MGGIRERSEAATPLTLKMAEGAARQGMQVPPGAGPGGDMEPLPEPQEGVRPCWSPAGFSSVPPVLPSDPENAGE